MLYHARLYALALLLTALSTRVVQAQTAVALAGILGSKALLVVNGSAPRGIAVGETHQGVRVISVEKEQALIEVDGARRSLRLGEAPVSVGSRTGGRRVVLMADARGHFINTGMINGTRMQYWWTPGLPPSPLASPMPTAWGCSTQKAKRCK